MSDKSTFLAALVPGVYLTRLPKSKRDKKTVELRMLVLTHAMNRESQMAHAVSIDEVPVGSKRSRDLLFPWATKATLDPDGDWSLRNLADQVIARFRITTTPDGEHPKKADKHPWL